MEIIGLDLSKLKLFEINYFETKLGIKKVNNELKNAVRQCSAKGIRSAIERGANDYLYINQALRKSIIYGNMKLFLYVRSWC